MDAPTERKVYKVEFNDCCVAGSFSSYLVHVHWDSDITGVYYPYELIFSNDVVLTEWLGCIFTEIEPQNDMELVT